MVFKKVFFFHLAILTFSNVYCQPDLNELLARSIEFRKTNQFDSALVINHQLESRLNGTGINDSILCEVYRNNGIIWKNQDIDSSKFYFSKAQLLAKELKDTTLLISILNNEALMLRYEDVKKSDSVFQIILQEYGAALTPKQTIIIRLNLVNNDLKNSEYERAIKSCEEAIEISKDNNFHELDHVIYSQLGNVYFHLGDYYFAIENYRISLQPSPNLTLNQKIAAFNSLSSCYMKIDSFERAIHFSDSVLLNNPRETSKFIALHNKATSLLKKGEIQAAEMILAGMKADNVTFQCYKDILATEIDLKKGDAERFLKKFEDSYECLMNYGDGKQKSDFLNQYFLFSLRDRDSLFYSEKMQLDKQINNSEMDALLRQIEIKNSIKEEEFKNQSLSIQNQLKDTQLKTQKTILYGGAGMLMLLLLLSISFYRQRKKQEAYNQKLTEQNQQIEMLQREVIHRTNNHLSLATNLIAMQKQIASENGAREVIEDSERKLRAIAAANKRLSGDYEGVNNLKEILEETVKDVIFNSAENKVDFHSDIEMVTLEKSHLSLIALIINELVVNSLKHAFHQISEPNISIEGYKKNGVYELTYKDNGNFKDSTKTSQGFGLIKGLVDQMDGKSFIETNNGFSFKLIIPIDGE